jgi:hypothetical protein
VLLAPAWLQAPSTTQARTLFHELLHAYGYGAGSNGAHDAVFMIAQQFVYMASGRCVGTPIERSWSPQGGCPRD